MGLSLSAQPKNPVTVDPSHGQMGYGSGPGAHGGDISSMGQPGQYIPGGYSYWSRQQLKANPATANNTYTDPQGNTMLLSNPNRRPIGQTGSQFENRKGNSPDPLRGIYIDDPHNGGGWI